MIVSDVTYSEVLGFDWNYSLYLPEDFAQRSYPILYLLHGAFGHHNDYVYHANLNEMVNHLMQKKLLPPMIIAMPDGFNSYYVDVGSLKMESAIIQSFIPYIENTYGIHVSKEERFIAGLSMGGYGASRFALTYPKLFSRAYLFSPAVWVEPNTHCAVRAKFHLFTQGRKPFCQELWQKYHPLSLFASYQKSASPVHFYVESGAQDEIVAVHDVNFFVQQLKRVAHVSYQVDDGSGHSWDFWRGATQRMFLDIGQVLQKEAEA